MLVTTDMCLGSANLVVPPATLLLVLDGVHVLNHHAAVLSGGNPVVAEKIILVIMLSIKQITQICPNLRFK